MTDSDRKRVLEIRVRHGVLSQCPDVIELLAIIERMQAAEDILRAHVLALASLDSKAKWGVEHAERKSQYALSDLTQWCYSRGSVGHNQLLCCGGMGDHAPCIYCKCCPGYHHEGIQAPENPCCKADCACYGHLCVKCASGEHRTWRDDNPTQDDNSHASLMVLRNDKA